MNCDCSECVSWKPWETKESKDSKETKETKESIWLELIPTLPKNVCQQHKDNFPVLCDISEALYYGASRIPVLSFQFKYENCEVKYTLLYDDVKQSRKLIITGVCE